MAADEQTTASRSREENARSERLAEIAEQVASGSLVIRTMTALERRSWSKRLAPATDGLSPAERRRREILLENRRRNRERNRPVGSAS